MFIPERDSCLEGIRLFIVSPRSLSGFGDWMSALRLLIHFINCLLFSRSKLSRGRAKPQEIRRAHMGQSYRALLSCNQYRIWVIIRRHWYEMRIDALVACQCPELARKGPEKGPEECAESSQSLRCHRRRADSVSHHH